MFGAAQETGCLEPDGFVPKRFIEEDVSVLPICGLISELRPDHKDYLVPQGPFVLIDVLQDAELPGAGDTMSQFFQQFAPQGLFCGLPEFDATTRWPPALDPPGVIAHGHNEDGTVPLNQRDRNWPDVWFRAPEHEATGSGGPLSDYQKPIPIVTQPRANSTSLVQKAIDGNGGKFVPQVVLPRLPKFV